MIYFKGRCIYTVYLMSDGYIGLDQQYDIHLDVLEPPKQAIQESKADDYDVDYLWRMKDKL